MLRRNAPGGPAARKYFLRMILFSVKNNMVPEKADREEWDFLIMPDVSWINFQ
jgi:hypothetical protein